MCIYWGYLDDICFVYTMKGKHKLDFYFNTSLKLKTKHASLATNH